MKLKAWTMYIHIKLNVIENNSFFVFFYFLIAWKVKVKLTQSEKTHNSINDVLKNIYRPFFWYLEFTNSDDILNKYNEFTSKVWKLDTRVSSKIKINWNLSVGNTVMFLIYTDWCK